MPRATVYDVARAAGVSIKTVSRVVNGSEQVSEATRDRVLTAVAELSYVRNPVAHSLRTGSSDTIGVVIDSIADRFFSSLVSVIEERALERGFNVLIASTGRDVDRERGQIQRLLQQNVAALLLAPAESDHSYLAAAAREIPVVLVDRGWELPGYDTIRVQDELGAHRATSHLADHGHNRIAFLAEEANLETTYARKRGYDKALADHGLKVDTALIRMDCGEASGADRAMRALLNDRSGPTAVFAANPRAAMGVVSALHATGRLDVALVSFGDFDLADSVNPAVTVIDQDPRPIAEAALERVLARLDDQELPPTEITLPVDLIERGSGELRP